jgi:hypothetical protein
MNLITKKIGVIVIFLAVCHIICPIEYYILLQIFGSNFFYVGFIVYMLISFIQGWFMGTLIGHIFLELDRLENNND